MAAWCSASWNGGGDGWKISSAVDPIEANALRGGNLSMRDSVVVSSQTLISNGCGASVGLEAGYTQIGSGIASLFGKFFNLRRNDLRLIVGCGAAAAIAAAFGAPITGAFYACELIVGVYSVGSAAPILAASLAGALTAQWLGGAPYSIEIPKVSAVGVEQYLALIGLALVTSGVGIAVMRSSSMFERLFKWLPVWLRPVIGGLIVGGFAIVTPQVLAAGHGAMVLDLFHDMTIGLIAIIIALKVTACLISLASGFRGGLFFASLFVGSLIGKFFSAVLLLISPNFVIDPLVAMLTGMATLGVAIVGGPLTMSFLVLEMTRNVDVTAVVLAGCIVTSICVRFMFGHSFSTWRLHLRGETIRSANDVGWLRNLTVERLMRSDVGKVPSTTTIAATRSEFPLGSRPGIVIVNNADEYVGLVLLPDLFSSDLDTIADDIQVIELARLTEIVLIPEMNVKSGDGGVRRGRGRNAGGGRFHRQPQGGRLPDRDHRPPPLCRGDRQGHARRAGRAVLKRAPLGQVDAGTRSGLARSFTTSRLETDGRAGAWPHSATRDVRCRTRFACCLPCSNLGPG